MQCKIKGILLNVLLDVSLQFENFAVIGRSVQLFVIIFHAQFSDEQRYPNCGAFCLTVKEHEIRVVNGVKFAPQKKHTFTYNLFNFVPSDW